MTRPISKFRGIARILGSQMLPNLWQIIKVTGIGVGVVSALLVITAVDRVQHDARNLHKNPTEANKREYDASLAWFQALVGATGTIATIFGAYVLYRNFEVANRNAQIALNNLELAESRLMTERFSKAVEQLGSDELEVRLGGVYALERIAQDSERDYWTIMEVLTAFIRQKSPQIEVSEERTRFKVLELQNQLGFQYGVMNPFSSEIHSQAERELYYKPVAIDIQAALTVIGRRQEKQRLLEEGKYLDLSNTNLREANLESAYLVGVSFRGTDFSKANLKDADLRKADLSKVNLKDALLIRADFSKANLKDADLSEANLSEAKLIRAKLIRAKLIRAKLGISNFSNANLNCADLSGADLSSADLSGADLSGANLSFSTLNHANLIGANLIGAIVSGANFRHANLSRADFGKADLSETDLSEADLSETDLSGVRTLTDHQLEFAKLCQTKLPERIQLNPDRDCKN